MPAFNAGSPVRGHIVQSVVLLAGLLLPQAILFAPCFHGTRVLLPLDLLALEKYYLPDSPETRSLVPHDRVQTDQVLVYEPARRFAAGEFHAGRLPLWNPAVFAGAPFAVFSKYSPYNCLYYAFSSPYTLVWIQLLNALIAGMGAYVFVRCVLEVGFWPAAVGAWCYPLTGFFVLWQGHALTYVTAWLPWVLLATDAAVRRPRGWGGPALGLLTGLTLISGAIDIAGQVLLASGVFALWRLVDVHGSRLLARPALVAAGVTAAAWALGFLLSAPYLLPLGEYVRTGDRTLQRSRGYEERKPAGLSALPAMVLPDAYGSGRQGCVFIGRGNPLESSAAAYTGLLATLLAAPLAFCSRPHRSFNLLWSILILIGVAWVLDLPGLVTLMRLPVLNLFSHNRFVFAASFAVLSLAVTGLEVVGQCRLPLRCWFVPVIVLVAGLGAWCLYRCDHLPEPVATELGHDVAAGHATALVPNFDRVVLIQEAFRRTYRTGAVLCGLGLVGWLLILAAAGSRPWFATSLGVLLTAELLWSAHGVGTQSDPALYYPRIPVLVKLAKLPPGRVLGLQCLPPNLHESHGLREVRGYDAVDPARVVQVLELVRDKRYPLKESARTQWYMPVLGPPAAPVLSAGTLGLLGAPLGQGPLLAASAFVTTRVQLPAVLNMLNVRYLILRQEPPGGVQPLLHEDDYWVVENVKAMPRAWIPERVEVVKNGRLLLEQLNSDHFDPRQVAYTDDDVNLPTNCKGTAELREEVPTRVLLEANMETTGLMVLADAWYEGWQATVAGNSEPILRVNHVLRGVRVPAGRSLIEFRYEPASLTWGIRLMAAAVLALLVWTWLVWRYGRRRRDAN